jgi:hypothetical protein
MFSGGKLFERKLGLIPVANEKNVPSHHTQTHHKTLHPYRFEICSCRGAISSFQASATLVALRWIRKALSLVEA